MILFVSDNVRTPNKSSPLAIYLINTTIMINLMQKYT